MGYLRRCLIELRARDGRAVDPDNAYLLDMDACEAKLANPVTAPLTAVADACADSKARIRPTAIFNPPTTEETCNGKQ